jgi:DNA invertase Pin-like site-specific DNA recombinase
MEMYLGRLRKMARKSRTAALTTPVSAAQKIYNTAIYARLSVEDCRDKESDSIENQIYLIKQYLEERPYLKLCSVFSDNGETGTNFNRPGFNAMMDDVRAGKIQCIVVKDLSRFGRNYIETGEYLEKIFPFMGIRFVSINDGFDNEDVNSNTDALIVSLKNLINDVYAKDISQKVISSLRTKQEKGEYIGGFAPYGYLKSSEDKHKLVIDTETAPIVRDIFKWKAEGMGDTLIARRLNEMGIPSPAKRHVDKGEQKRVGKCKLFIWRDRTIRAITESPMYIGHMAQGRTKKALYDNTPFRVQPKSEWIIVKNTHEPIIDLATFERAQEARANNTGAFYKNYDKSKHMSGEKHLFKSLLVCAECGSTLIRVKTRTDPAGYSFICPVKRKNLGTDCSPKLVGETYLYKGVLESIKKEVKLAVNLSALVERLNKLRSADNPEISITKRIAKLQTELKRLTSLKASLYENYVDKLLTEDEYIFSKQKYTKQMEEAKQRLEYLQEESVTHTKTLTPQNKWLQAFKRFTDHDELSSEMIHTLIDHITVCGNNDFHIVWNFRNEYEAICEYTGEVSA